MKIPNLQRDQEQQKFISSVYSNLKALGEILDPQQDIKNPHEISFVSFEQALKELTELKSS